MKTAISMPDVVFKRAEQLARRLGMSRSRLFCLAVEQFLTRYADQEVTDALDRVYAEHDGTLDAQVAEMQTHVVGGDTEGW